MNMCHVWNMSESALHQVKTGGFFMLEYKAYVGIKFGCECNKDSGLSPCSKM
jgi:hypothetical protein